MSRREAADWSVMGTRLIAEVRQSRQVPASRNAGRPEGDIDSDAEAERPRPCMPLNRSMLATANLDPLGPFM